MEIVDKEQEKIQYEKTPEGKKKKTLKNVGIGIFVVCFLGYVYLSSHHPYFIGTPHIVEISGISIEPGKTTVQNIADAGYELSDYSSKGLASGGGTMVYDTVYDIEAEAEGNTYYYMIDVIKGNDKYAGMSVINESKQTKPLAQCVVRDVKLYSNLNEVNKAKIDGVSVEGITLEKLTEVCGSSYKESTSENRNVYTWEKGNYGLEATFEADGSFYSLESKYEKDN